MQVIKPTILLDKERVVTNIKRMITKAKKSGVLLRAHFKTHQSADIGKWFKDEGVKAITVSSVDMAEYFADNGWNDIVIAFPVNISQITQINNLAKRIDLGLLVESSEVIKYLTDNLSAKISIWIKIDTGYHRTGLNWDDEAKITRIIREIKKSDKMRFIGLLTHAGQTYKAKNIEEIKDIYQDTIIKLQAIQEQLFLQGFSKVKISIGDTPSCSVIDDFTGVDEIRPGNFVFYDIKQLSLGVCREEDIAVAVACPIVAKHLERNEIIIYGGAIHLSKDYLEEYFNGEITFGLIALPKDNGWGKIQSNAYVSSLSQEHGVVKAPKEFIEKLQIGDTLIVLPIHSCLTANSLRKYYTLDGQALNFNTKA